jgi:hypothetical protein
MVANDGVLLRQLEANGVLLFDLTGLTTGLVAYVRVRAINTEGPSPWTTAASPAFMMPQRHPDAVASATLTSETVSATPITSIRVDWTAPEFVGGSALTHYLVEWWRTIPDPEVQEVTLSNSNGRLDTAGTFVLKFLGEQTAPLEADVSAYDLRRALMQLNSTGTPVINHLEVSRTDLVLNTGYKWSITFSLVGDSPTEYGDVPSLVAEPVTGGPGSGALESVSSCTDDCIVLRVVNPLERGARIDGTPEVQTVTVRSDGMDTAGFFRLSFEGSGATPYLAHDISGADLADALENLPTTNQVEVNRVAATGGFEWHVTFTTLVGDRSALVMDSDKVTGTGVVAMVEDGDNAIDANSFVLCEACVVGETPFEYAFVELPVSQTSYTITGRVPGLVYSARVTAFNGKGGGVATLTTPPRLTVPQQRPGAPTGVTTSVSFGQSSQLLVDYTAPTSDGGDDILMYRIEYSTTSGFLGVVNQKDIYCPASHLPEIWEVTTTPTNPGDTISDGKFSIILTQGGVDYPTLPIHWDAPPMTHDESVDVGVYCTPDAAFCVNDDSPGAMQSFLEDLPPISSVTVSRTPLGLGAFIWSITFQDDGTDFDLRLNDDADTFDFNGTVRFDRMQDGQLSSTLNCESQQTIDGLTQGVPVFVRVAAQNSEGFGDATVADSGAATTPQRVPSRPTSVSLTVTGATTLRTCFSPPEDTGGATVTQYKIETDTSAAFALETTRVEYLNHLADGGPYCFTIQHLTTGVDYYVRVSAGNAQGFGEAQSTTNPFEHPRTVPQGPTNVRLVTTSDTKLTVAWDPPTDNGGDDVVTYLVEWDIEPFFESLSLLPHKGSIVVSAAQNESVTISELLGGQSYFFRVSCTNTAGTGLPINSSPSSAAPDLQRPGLPSAIQLSNTTASVGDIVVSWSAPVVPFHGEFCSGGGTTVPFDSFNVCPDGMGIGQQADGGSPITSYEVQWSVDATFDTSVFKQSRIVSAAELASGAEFFTSTLEGLSVHSTIYVRVFAINGPRGIGLGCGNEGALCDGDVLAIMPQSA